MRFKADKQNICAVFYQNNKNFYSAFHTDGEQLLSTLLLFVCFSNILHLLAHIFFCSLAYPRKGLFISDVPLHDATRDLVLLSEKFEAEYKLTRNLEILTDKLQQTFRELDSEKQKTDR